jgi:hypothetical protein
MPPRLTDLFELLAIFEAARCDGCATLKPALARCKLTLTHARDGLSLGGFMRRRAKVTCLYA